MADPVDIQLTQDAKRKLTAAAKKIGDQKALYGVVHDSFATTSLEIAGNVSKGMQSGSPRIRSGDLARAVTGRAIYIGQIPGLAIGIYKGPALRYGPVQELGTKKYNPDSPFGTIVPRKGKRLTIPTRAGNVLTPAGVPRYDSARDYPGGLRYVALVQKRVIGSKSVTGAEWLYAKKDYDAAFLAPGDLDDELLKRKPQYLLLKKVDIKPNFFLRDGLQRNRALISRGLAEDLAALVKEAFDG